MIIYAVMCSSDTEGERLVTLLEDKEFAEEVAWFNGGESYVEEWDTEKEKKFYKNFVR